MLKYLYEDLSEEAGRAIQSHLANCAACRLRFDSFRRNQVDVADLTHGWPSSSLAHAAVQHWSQEKRQPMHSSGLRWGRLLAYSAAFAVCAAFAIVFGSFFAAAGGRFLASVSRVRIAYS